MLDPAHGHSETIRKPQQQAKSDRRPGDDLDIAKIGRDIVTPEIAGGNDWHGREDDMRGQLCTRPATPGHQTKQPKRHRPQVTPEIDHNCKQGAYMNRNIDQQALIRPPQNI